MNINPFSWLHNHNLASQQPQQPAVENKANLSYHNVDDHSIHYEDNDYSVKIITQGTHLVDDDP